MGSRGPVPKRTDHLHGHRSKASKAAVSKVDGAAAAAPDLALERVHPLAVAWFESLSDGPEAQFYTPAIWQRARVVTQVLSDFLYSPKPSSMMYTALQGDMKSLLVDAGELRRLSIEVQAAEPAQSNVIDWRARATASG